MYDLTDFIKSVYEIVEKHRVDDNGIYSEKVCQNEEDRTLGMIMYGSAEAVNILYTIRRIPTDENVRKKYIKTLQQFQNADSGLFEKPGNYTTHTTAFMSGALNLLGAKPMYRAFEFDKYKEEEELKRLMNTIDWEGNPWLGAHIGAGIYSSILLTGNYNPEWEELYFKWLDENQDEKTGLWKKGSINSDVPMFSYIAAAFHYVFIYEYTRRKIPYQEKLLDTCIRAYNEGNCPDFSTAIGWHDIDYTYILYRLAKRTGYSGDEVGTILKKIADDFIKLILGMDPYKSEELNNLNKLLAVVSALAILQEALPGEIKTENPLRLVLDKTPFI